MRNHRASARSKFAQESADTSLSFLATSSDYDARATLVISASQNVEAGYLKPS